MRKATDLRHWIRLALDYNKKLNEERRLRQVSGPLLHDAEQVAVRIFDDHRSNWWQWNTIEPILIVQHLLAIGHRALAVR